MGKDSQGINRGRCSKPGCDCGDFIYKKDKGVKCSNCGHVPTVHADIRFEIQNPLDEFLSTSEGEIADKEFKEETYENVNDDLRHQPGGSSMDIRGNLRGECTVTRCKCRQFSCIAEQGAKCTGCGHPPVKHVNKGANTWEDEVEKDSAPILFTRPQNSSPLKRPWPSVSDLCIDDMEEKDAHFKSHRRLLMEDAIRDTTTGRSVPMDYASGSHPTGFPWINSEISNQSMTDSSRMIPAYNQTDFSQHDTVLPTQTNLASQTLAGVHTQQPFAISTNATFNVPAQPPPQPIAQPSVQQQRVCKLDGCSNPVYVENGKVHDFCSRTHARKATALKNSSTAGEVPAHLKCINPSCGRMKYFDQKRGTHLGYCGMSCKESHRKSQQLPAAGPQVLPENTCLLPGCNRPKHSNFNYCGKSHAKQAQARNFSIQKASTQEFNRINTQFTNQWAPRKGTCGQLYKVFVITNLKLRNQFEKYRSSLAIKTVSQHYHGTTLKCAIYQSSTVCSNETCGICGISQNGMLPKFIGTNITFKRFGKGFYLAPNSSKCHDYTQGYDQYRAMLLFDVAEGNKHIVTNDQTTLTAPPQGYDSVYGQSGSALNYDEIVLYKSEALLPTHILIYVKDGIRKIAT